LQKNNVIFMQFFAGSFTTGLCRRGRTSEFAFARAFKRATGSAPGQYRKLAQAAG
jgi:hypothetical protein